MTGTIHTAYLYQPIASRRLKITSVMRIGLGLFLLQCNLFDFFSDALFDICPLNWMWSSVLKVCIVLVTLQNGSLCRQILSGYVMLNMDNNSITVFVGIIQECTAHRLISQLHSSILILIYITRMMTFRTVFHQYLSFSWCIVFHTIAFKVT